MAADPHQPERNTPRNDLDTQPPAAGAGRKPSHVASLRPRDRTGEGVLEPGGRHQVERGGGFTAPLDLVPPAGRIVCQPADRPDPAR